MMIHFKNYHLSGQSEPAMLINKVFLIKQNPLALTNHLSLCRIICDLAASNGSSLADLQNEVTDGQNLT